MLESIRRWNLGIKIILGFIVLTFVVFYAGDFAGVNQNDPSRHIAAVGSERIGFVEFQNMVNAIKDQQQFFNKQGDINPQMLAFFRQQAVNTLVDRKLMLMEGKKAGLKASQEEVRREILASPYFSRDGNFIGMEEYQRVVDIAFKMDVESFEEMVAEDVIVRKYNDLLTSGILVTDKEVEERYRDQNLTANIDYVPVQAGPFEKDVQVTPEDARNYYNANKKEFETGELRKVQYLWISHESEKNRVQLSEQKLKEFYEQNIERYSRPEQIRARHILLNTEGKNEAEVKTKAEDLIKQLKSGADFNELAKKNSEEPGADQTGGDLGFFERGRMVPEFDQVAFSLPVNQISDPVKTQFGYHIIQVLDKQQPYKMDFALVKDQIYRQMAGPEAVKNAQEQATKIHDEIVKNKKSMEEISKLQFVELKSTDFFAQNEDIRGLSPGFRQAAFNLKKGEISEPVPVFQDFAILKLVDTKDSSVPSFENVQAKAMERLRKAKAEELAKQKAQEVYASVSGSDLKAAAEKANLTVKSTGSFNAGGFIPDVGQAPAVSKRAFEMQVGQVSEPVKTDQGYIVFQVKEKKEFNQADFEKEKDQIRQGLISEKQNSFLQSYRSLLRKKYEQKIWINQEAVNPQA